MKARSGRGLIGSLLGGLGFLTLAAGLTAASEGRQVAVTLDAGETYVIKDLSAGATPAVHVEDNPSALIVNSGKPGELALVGESAGKWKIDVETADGEKVSYRVEVAAVDKAGSGARVTSEATPAEVPSLGSTADKPVVSAALDAGSGPVAPTMPAMAIAPIRPVASAAADSVAAAITPAAAAPMKLADASLSSASTSASMSAAPIAAASARAAAPATAPTTLADASTLPPVPYSGSAATSNGPTAISNETESTATGDTMGSGMLLPSQVPPQGQRRFRNNLPAPTPSDAVNGGTHYLPDDVVELSAGSSAIYDFPRRIRRISIADTGVADLQVVNPFQINLVGHKEGFTTLAVWDIHGQYEERQIRVDSFGRQQVMLNVIVAELNRSRMEAQGIDWSLQFSNYNFSILGLPGGLSSVSQGSVLPPSGIIPLLLSTNVNYALVAGGQGVNTQTFFNFLEQHSLAKVLAEPHLLANSGEKAEFLSGGEIPIVLAQALNTSIVFKQFGVSVIFVPTVIGRDDIALEVKPEVSQPDFSLGVNLFGFTVPAFITRRAQTFVRLKNNQTLIIAGLLLRTRTSQINKTPYLGDLPYLGYLFKRTTYQDQRSDLVMSVTPQIVSPMPGFGEPVLPTDHPQLTQGDIETKRLSTEDASRPRF
ncbi:MAG: pilus assembly protein N-terminal domain-containing protein [Candidatus Binataceae bacterium]